MSMSQVSALSRQLANSIEVLQHSIENADDTVWLYGSPPFYQIVFHTIYALDMYFSTFDVKYTKLPDQYLLPEEFQPFNELGFYDKELEAYDQPYKVLTREVMLNFLKETRDRIRVYFSQNIASQFDDPSGFPWLNFTKFELIIHNIRHIMGHTGVLNEYLKTNNKEITGWIGRSEL